MDTELEEAEDLCLIVIHEICVTASIVDIIKAFEVFSREVEVSEATGNLTTTTVEIG